MLQYSFGKYYCSVFTRPAVTFAMLMDDSRKLRFSFFAVFITALLYTFVYVFLIFGDGRPFKPWLNIAPEEYYRYNVFFCLPSMFLAWILASGVLQLVSRLITRQGTFEQALAVTGFAISIASWSTGIHDILTSFLGAVHIIDQQQYEAAMNSPTIWRILLWVQMLIYLVWFILLFSKGSKVVYGTRTWQAALLGALAFVMYQGFFFIFNR